MTINIPEHVIEHEALRDTVKRKGDSMTGSLYLQNSVGSQALVIGSGNLLIFEDA